MFKCADDEAFKVLHLASCGPDSAGVDGEVCLEFLEFNAVLNSFEVATFSFFKAPILTKPLHWHFHLKIGMLVHFHRHAFREAMIFKTTFIFGK